MLNIDATFLLVFLSFVVFMLCMKGFYFDPVQQIKQAREDKIQEDRDTSVRFKEKSQQLQAEYDLQIRSARQKAQQTILEFREQAKKSATGQTAKVREDLRLQLEDQLNELAKWREDVYQQIAPEKSRLVELVLGKILKMDLNKTPATTLEH